MTTILDQEETTVRDHSGVNRITIPDRWARMLNLESGTECTLAIVNGKHGLFLATWSENQPEIEEVEELE